MANSLKPCLRDGSLDSILAESRRSCLEVEQQLREDLLHVAGLNLGFGGEGVSAPTAVNVGQRVVSSFVAIKESSFILYEDKILSGCGSNNVGQLGDGTNTNKVIVSTQLDGRANRLYGGPTAQTIFITTDNSVWGTGLNDRGQVGVGDTQNRYLLTRVEFEGPVLIDLVLASTVHTVALGSLLADPATGS